LSVYLKSIDLSLGLDSIQIFLKDCEEKVAQGVQEVVRQKEAMENFNQSSASKNLQTEPEE
jgi:hypothetical protein